MLCVMRTTSNGRSLLLAAALVTISFAASGAEPRAQTAAPLPERGVGLLTLDFAVVTADGRPVADLKAEEVTIRIGGKQRPVRSLQLIAVDDAHAAGADGAAKARLPQPFGTNAQSETGRLVVLIIDDDSFRSGREQPLRDAVSEFLARLSPHDRVSLVTIPYGGVKVPLTVEHSRIRTALLTIVGQAASGETGSALACRTRATLESLYGYLDSMGVRTQPSTIVFVSAGLAAPRRDAPITRAPGICELPVELYTRIGTVAGAARAHFYVVMLEHVNTRPAPQVENIAGTGFTGSDNPMEGLENLTGVTGGTLLNLTRNSGTALGQVFQETSSYYLATFDARPSDRGRSHQVDLRVSRRNVGVRSRPEISFAAADRMGARQDPSPRDMIASPTVFRDLPLRASAYSSNDPATGKIKVVAMAEPIEPGVKLSAAVAGLFNREGRLVAQWAATAADLAAPTVVGALAAEPGGYRLRVAAIDSTGRAGTADYDVTAELADAGALLLSSVVLGVNRGANFVPRLQFGAEPVAIGIVEIYGGVPGARLSTALEISATLHGPPLVAVPLAISRAGEERYVATGAIPLAALPPGDYIVRAMVGIEGQSLGRVMRTLRKVAVQ